MKGFLKKYWVPMLATIVVVAIFAGLFALMVSYDRSREAEKAEKIQKGERFGEGADIEIVKVRDCEYVLWHNGYGSDMEHYEGCANPAHKHK